MRTPYRRRRGRKTRERNAAGLDESEIVFPSVYEEYWMGRTFWV